MSSDAKYQPSLHEYMQFLQTLPQLLPTATQYAAALRQAQLLGASPVRVMQTGLAGLRDLWNFRLGNVGPWTTATSDAHKRLTLVVRAYAFAAFGCCPQRHQHQRRQCGRQRCGQRRGRDHFCGGKQRVIIATE